MKKDKEWLLNELKEMLESPKTNIPALDTGYELAIKDFKESVIQLDEPEISQKQVDKYLHERDLVAVDAMMVHQTGMQNKVVVEKPGIPQFVADWMRENHGYNIYGALAAVDKERHSQVHDWVFFKGGINDFTRAWLDGFTIANVEEEEQKYILSISITDEASKTNYETFLNKRGIFHSMENDSFNSEEFNWTEEEIRGLTKGDILFEHFAAKVEELD